MQNYEQKQENAAADHDPRSVQRSVEVDEGRDQTENHAPEQSAGHKPDAARQHRAAEHDGRDRVQFVAGARQRVARRGIERVDHPAEGA